ncbi:MAG: glycosyltransferase family 2 protein [Nitriliruptoraceae bacterium]
MQVSATARVLVVIVSHDGSRWLPAVLECLRTQDFSDIDLLAVDNASEDGSRDYLIERLGPERVLVADRDLGFGGAVSMALDACSDDVEYVWLLHDDVAFLPDALSTLVAALDTDPRVAIVGPKLRDWSQGEQLQSVGWTIDLTGRADSGVDPGELDQGQRDTDRRTLYVSTAGMLLRRSAFEALGRFDRRFHVFRDDLDLCWRAWLADYEVEVVPEAMGAHVAAASEHVRLGQTRHLGPRYFAERNTLAALLKNYGPIRLPLVVVLYVLVGLAKIAGFVLTRRFSDAWQTLRAWVWNVLHLRETLRLRRQVQHLRRRTDTELKPLFGRITPRVRAYLEAIVYWVTGGDTTPARADAVLEPAEDVSRSRLVAFARQRPVAVAGIVLVLAVIGGAGRLLAPGALRGGGFAPWPSSPQAFLANYVASFNEAAVFGTSAPPSPVQALLGLLHLVAGGSSYLAPRLLLFGTVAAAWIFALRAAQVYSARRVPRVVAATAYVLSPPAMAALVTGELRAMVLLAVIPGVVAAGLTFGSRSATAVRAWRAVSAAAVLGAIGAAFEPVFLGALVVAGAVVVLVVLTTDVPALWKRVLVTRVIVATGVPVVLLLPWSATLLAPDGPVFGADGARAGGALWQWLALTPELAGFPGLFAGLGFVLAGALGLVLGVKRTPGLVGTMWAVALIGAAAGWWLGRTGSAVWPGTPLLLTAAAFAALYALAFASAESQLGRFGFGWRQLSALVTVVAVTVSIGTVITYVARSPLDTYAIDNDPLPAFIAASVAEEPNFRVLVLAQGGAGLAWEVVDGAGPTMAAMGVPDSPVLDTVGTMVDDLATGRDPTIAAALGTLGIRYVVVPPGGTSPELDHVLRHQLHLEPRPVADGRVYRVSGWLPPAAIVDVDVVEALRTHDLPAEDAHVTSLVSTQPGRYEGRTDDGGIAIMVAPADTGWVVEADGRPVPAMEPIAERPGVQVFGPVADGAQVVVRHEDQSARTLVVTGQVLLVLLVVSLALRPPRFARRRSERAPAAEPQLARSTNVKRASDDAADTDDAVGAHNEDRP